MRRTLLVLVALLILGAASQPASVARCAVAAERGSPTEQDPAARLGAVIRGRIVAADTGLPIGDASVSVLPLGRGATGSTGGVDAPPPERGVVVDGSGRFEITGLAPGYYRLVATPGSSGARYLTGRFPDPRLDDPPVLTIAGQELITGVEIRLPSAAVITGRVVDERGHPIVSVAVSARPILPGNRPANEVRAAVLPVMTDDMGSFRLFGLPPGDYLVHARPVVAGHVRMILPDGVSVTRYGRRYAAAYYPGTSSIANTVPIRVLPGDTVGPIELSLADSRVLTLRGMLLGPAGHPVSNAPVYVRRAGTTSGMPDPDVPGALPALDDGTFEIAGLAAGEYHVGATRFLGDVREIGWTSVQVIDDVDDVVVRLMPGVTVRGQVLFEGRVPSSMSGLRVGSVSVAPIPVDAVTAEPDLHGGFLLAHQHGPTLVRIEGLQGWHLKTVLYGREDVTDRPVTFVERGPDLQVVLTDRGASIAGRVRTARGSPVDAVVLLVSDNPSQFHELSTTTRQARAGGDGVYRVEGLRAGRYFAVALDPDEPSFTGLTREYFDLLARDGTAVVVHDGQAATLNLTLIDRR